MEDIDEHLAEAADNADPDYSPGPCKSTKTPVRRKKMRRRLTGRGRKLPITELRKIVKGLQELGPTRMKTLAKRLNIRHTTLMTIVQLRAKLAWKTRRRRSKTPLSTAVALVNEKKGKRSRTYSSVVNTIPSAVLSLVALEKHPEPSDSEINYKSLYQAVHNAMYGLPMPSMNAPTKAYLVESMEWLLHQAQTLVPRGPQQSSLNAPSNKALSELLKMEAVNPLGLGERSCYVRNKGCSTPGFSPLSYQFDRWLSKSDWDNI